MRNVLCDSLVGHAARKEFVFLTGDLGYNALEPLRAALGDRFINSGVAEQNMVSVAAGMSSLGLVPWVYSIAPFAYARPFEQIRNDVCMHGLHVVIVGNGGGYAYGPMGATHHGLEDYGTLLTLPGMHAFVPAFASDVPVIVDTLFDLKRPSYLRLGRCEKPGDFVLPPYAPWRRLLDGRGPAMVAVGPLAGGILEIFRRMDPAIRPALWVLTELPIRKESMPEELVRDIRQSGALFVIEEHVAHGGAGQMLSYALTEMNEAPCEFIHKFAKGYVSGLYGSQLFHRKECGLDPESVAAEVVRRYGTAAKG